MGQGKTGDNGRHDRLMIGLTILAIILIAAINIALVLIHPTTGGENATASVQAQAEATGRSKTETTQGEAARMTAVDVCADIAPKATKAYVTDTSDRDRLIAEYFTKDATGLNIPIARIQPQPQVEYAGGLNVGDDTTATCSVHTGLESPWTLTYRWTPEQGWQCTGIQGPIDGAYKLQGDKIPDKENQ